MTLADYVRGERPVIFTLNYSDCPMLCSLQLSGLSAALGKLDRQLGVDFDVVTVSLNPAETTERARETEARYRSEVATARGGQASAGAAGWSFLTGSQQHIDALAEALGVRYGYNEARKEYVHPAVAILSTPSGRISRYLFGVEYAPRDLRLALVEASAGRLGTLVDRLLLFCYAYDPSAGAYSLAVLRTVRVAGLLTVALLAAFITMSVRRTA